MVEVLRGRTYASHSVGFTSCCCYWSAGEGRGVAVGLPFLQWEDAGAEKLGFGVCGLSRPSGRWASGCRG